MVAAGDPTFASDLNTEAAEIDTLTGAWTAYTPAILNWVIGNGTLAGRYRRHGAAGKTMDWYMQLVCGSTTTYVGSLLINFPIASAVINTATLQQSMFVGHAIDISVGLGTPASHFEISARLDTSFRVIPFRTAQFMAAATPFAWATGDILRLSGTIEFA